MRTLLAFAALLPSAILAANPEAATDDEVAETLADDVVVTATRGPTSAFNAPVRISRTDGSSVPAASCPPAMRRVIWPMSCR